MGIIPKKGDKKEPIGLIPLVLAHVIIGLGITVVGQRTKNRNEFLGGIIVFLVVLSSFFNSGLGLAVPLISILSWIYLLGRIALIYKSKEVEIKLL